LNTSRDGATVAAAADAEAAPGGAACIRRIGAALPAGEIGNSTKNEAPAPGRDSRRMRPPCSCTIA
jgi:hypothetical protein